MRGNLVRKQFLVSREQERKVKRLASRKGTSAAEIVRQAIDAYDPDQQPMPAESELLELVSQRVNEAIEATRRASRKVSDALERLQGGEGR